MGLMENKKKSLLWLSHFVPYPPKGGAFQRSYNLIKQVSRYYDIYLIAVKHKSSTHPINDDAEAKAALSEFCKDVVIVDLSGNFSGVGLLLQVLKSLFGRRSITVNGFISGYLREQIKRLLSHEKIVLAHIDAISLAPYESILGTIPKVLNHHGAEGLMVRRRIKREKSVVKRLLFRLEAYRLVNDEKRYCGRFDKNLVVSDLDKTLLQSVARNAEYTVIENGVDVGFFNLQKRSATNPSIIFAGRLDQYSNRDGILWFCSEVWPLIQKQAPDCRLMLIGNNPPDELKRLAMANANITVPGFVDDVRDYFKAAMVCITPIRSGGGTRIKVLDALAMGMPIVATSIAAEGLEVTDEENILIADDAEKYAAQIVRLFQNPDLRERLGEQGIKLINEKYSWEIIGDKLKHVYDALLEKKDLPFPAHMSGKRFRQ